MSSTANGAIASRPSSRNIRPIVEMASIDEAYLDLAGTERLHGPRPRRGQHAAARNHVNDGPALLGRAWRDAPGRQSRQRSSQAARPRLGSSGSEAAFLAPLAVRQNSRNRQSDRSCRCSLSASAPSRNCRRSRSNGWKKTSAAGARRSIARRAESIPTNSSSTPSRSRSRTIKPSAKTRTTRELLHSTLSYLCQKAAKRLRDAGLHARTVTLTLRFADFRTITRNHTLAEPSDLDTVFSAPSASSCPRVERQSHAAPGRASRSRRFSAGSEQLDLLDPGRREKLERLARATDRLRDRFGFSKVQLGGIACAIARPVRGAPQGSATAT